MHDSWCSFNKDLHEAYPKESCASWRAGAGCIGIPCTAWLQHGTQRTTSLHVALAHDPDCRPLCLQSLLELSRSQPSEGSGHSQVEVSPQRPIRPRTTPQPQHPQLQSSNSLHGVTHPDHQLRTPGGINDWPACPIPRSASAQHAPPRPIPPPSDSALRRHPVCCKRSRSDTLAFSLPDHRQEGTAVPSPHAPAPPPAAKQEAGHGNPMWSAVMQLLQTQLDFPARQDALGALLGLQVCHHLGWI